MRTFISSGRMEDCSPANHEEKERQYSGTVSANLSWAIDLLIYYEYIIEFADGLE